MDIILYILIGLALFSIIICIGLVLSKCNDDDCIWIHLKTGNEYRLYQLCKAKINGEWVDVVIYMSLKDGEIYVREYNDFILNFKTLSEWKKD